MIKLQNNDYKIDKDCTLFLYDTLKEYIIYHAKEYSNIGIDIWLTSNEYFRIKYCNHIYKFCVVKKDNLLYYYLAPYNKSYFLTLAISYDVFDTIIQAIKDNQKMIDNKKKKVSS